MQSLVHFGLVSWVQPLQLKCRALQQGLPPHFLQGIRVKHLLVLGILGHHLALDMCHSLFVKSRLLIFHEIHEINICLKYKPHSIKPLLGLYHRQFILYLLYNLPLLLQLL